jgi:hypothetical protein
VEGGVRIRPLHTGRLPWEWGIALRRQGDVAVERFRNAPDGIEHDVDIREAVALPVLHLEFALAGNLTPKVSEDGQSVSFQDPAGASVLVLLDLRGLDSEGREVDVHWERIEPLEKSGPALRLRLEPTDHAFPLHIRERIASPKRAIPRERNAQQMLDAWAATAPANDLCSGAQVVPGAGPFPYLSAPVDLTSATTTGDPPSPSCQADVSRGVWFAFTPSSSASYSFSVCSGATGTTIEDTVLAIYSAAGTCAGLAEIGGGCDDDSCGPSALQSAIQSVSLAAGSTYYVVAWSFGTLAPLPGAGTLQLQVVRDPPPGPTPPNDRCDGAETIPGDGPFPYLTTVMSDIGSATTTGDPPAPSCQPSVSRSVWYSFTPTVSGPYTFSVCADGPTGTTVDDTVLGLYAAAAACSGLAEAPGGCDDDSCGTEAAQSVISGVGLAAGTRYYLVVWKYGATAPAAASTAVQVRVSRGTSPSNDTCAAGTALALDALLSGTSVGAVDDTGLPSGSTCFVGIGQTPSTALGGDVSYAFAAPSTGRFSFRLAGYESSKNAVLYVASDCPAGGSPTVVTGCLGAANRSSAFPEEVSCLPLVAGQRVYVYVDEDSLTSGSSFTIEATRCSLESEPNGAPASAGSLFCGVEGSIAPPNDADFFALGTAESGSRVFAIVDGVASNSTDFDLRVSTASDTLEYDDYNNDVPFGSASPNVSGTPLTGAAAYLRVSHYSPVAQAEPYRLYAAVQPPSSHAAPEVEPNDTIVAATGDPGGYYAGALSSSSDVDAFSFSAVAGERVQLGLDLDPTRDGTPFNGSLALLDGAGATLLVVNDPALGSSRVAGSGSLIATTPYSPGEALVSTIRTAGTYFARVAWSAGTPGDYLLSIAHECRVGPPVGSTDADGDGVPDAADCAPSDAAVWAVPGEATGLVFSSKSLLQWSSPSAPGGSVVQFDVLRSTTADDFLAAACRATNSLATATTDAELPSAVFFYLVRSENVCGGNLGTASDGSPRSAGTCP